MTALLVHVGWIRNRAFYGYYGIGQDLLRPSLQDYVLRSAAMTALGVGVVLRLGPSLFVGTSVSLGKPTTFTLYVVLVVALFWAAPLYAQDLGRRAAYAADVNPAGLPLVTVFSEDFLDLPGSHVRATPVPGPDGKTPYRYSGMSLLTYSNGTWFLINGRYSDDYRSSVLVLRDSAGLRVEVAAPKP